MAVNESRSMNAEFHQGCIDESYIQLAPDRGGVPSVMPVEKLAWPTYRNAEKLVDHPFWESMVERLHLPRERKTSDSGDIRF
jgi:hypothetical protein